MTNPPDNPPRHRWDTSQRRQDSPQWKAIRSLVAERDNHRCQEFMRDGEPCTDKGTECDHIIPVSQGGTDSLENLRMLCTWHHARKSSREGQAARKNLTERRPTPRHPGLI